MKVCSSIIIYTQHSYVGEVAPEDVEYLLHNRVQLMTLYTWFHVVGDKKVGYHIEVYAFSVGQCQALHYAKTTKIFFRCI